MDDAQFRRLLDALGYSFEGYRRVRRGVKKRIRRHMRVLGCRGLDDYLVRLAASREVRTACIRRMTVPISRFWRDRPLWEALRDKELPALRQRFGHGLRAWSAGCACGEEAYSLAMADRESRAARGQSAACPLSIAATDLNPVVLAKARAGIYPASSLREVPDDLVSAYFVPLRGGRRYRIRRALLGSIRWRRWAIEAPAWAGPFHLILLRNNVLTYLERPRQIQVLGHALDQLHPGGLLVTGLQESLPAGATGLTPAVDSPACLYRHTGRDTQLPA